MKAEKIIKEHMRKLGAKGGSKTSKAKKLASKKSLEKARKALAKARKELKAEREDSLGKQMTPQRRNDK